MIGLYYFRWACGRMGDLDGLFVADDENVTKIIGNKVYFGEVLGKHSEIYGVVEKEEIKLITTDKDFIDKLIKLTGGHNTICGHNPVAIFNDREEEN